MGASPYHIIGRFIQCQSEGHGFKKFVGDTNLGHGRSWKFPLEV